MGVSKDMEKGDDEVPWVLYLRFSGTNRIRSMTIVFFLLGGKQGGRARGGCVTALVEYYVGARSATRRRSMRGTLELSRDV